jgi:hypothetical protein
LAESTALIIGSILLNYGLGTALAQSGGRATGTRVDRGRLRNRRMALAIGIASNLMLLGYYKYTGFVLQNFNALLGVDFSVPHILLPLAISFFTFTQIVNFVDSYRGETADYSLLSGSFLTRVSVHISGKDHVTTQLYGRDANRPRLKYVHRFATLPVLPITKMPCVVSCHPDVRQHAACGDSRRRARHVLFRVRGPRFSTKASGRPIVGPYAQGPGDLVQHNETESFLEPGDIASVNARRWL